MKKLLMCIPFFLLVLACEAQEKQNIEDKAGLVGGPCEGCEAIYEWGDKNLSPVDTLPDFREEGPKLKITGTIYQKDGKTPAKDVILYIYHTDQKGVYPTRGHETGWAKRHGYLRGWIKTGADGKYAFYTLKPATYPDRSEPAHIHATVKEPGLNEYYLDDYLFENDPLLENAKLNEYPRGGFGIVSLKRENTLLIAKRDIILGLNIPDYE